MTNSSPTPSKKQINPFAKLLMYLFAVPAVGIGEGTKALFRKTYSRNESIIPLIVGAVVALATGIGAGYQAGWVNDLVLWKWVGYGVASATVSFFYLWPLFYLALFQWPFRISEALWKHVNIEGESRRDQPPAWFSTTLIFLGYVAVVAGALYVAYGVDIAVQANQAGWWWLGAILGVLSAILVVVVVIAILGFVGEEMSGGLAFFLFLAMVALTWWFWGPVSGFASGAWNSLTGKDWGNWGYVAGIIPAAISGLVVGGIAGTLLNWLRLRLIAVLTGLAAVYFLTPTTTALVNGIELGSFSLITPALPWAASALALFVYIGLVFPLAHIAVTHGLKRLPDLLDALKEAYDEKNKRYRSFIAQVTTIAAVVAIFWFVPALLTATFGLTALWAVYGLTSLAAIAVYLVGGNLLDNTGIGPQGLAISIAAGYFTFHWSIALSFGTVASSFIGTAAGMFTFLLAFPLAYVVVRFVADPLLASWLAEPLVKLNHKAAISFMDLVESLTEAADRTYGDKTPYAPTFLHLVNL
ncbi:MAG: hypothetical protein K8F91_27370, partial [Candidatus Obscuribacterales bacterium]|nr:hypothetical protein [Candidatus Obscuribacterales bacterium]